MSPLIQDPLTAKRTDLFNVSDQVLLELLADISAHPEESPSELANPATLTAGLMFQEIKPLGNLITTLPVGPCYPDRTLAQLPAVLRKRLSSLPIETRPGGCSRNGSAGRPRSVIASETRCQGRRSRREPIGSSILSLAHSLAEVRAAWGHPRWNSEPAGTPECLPSPPNLPRRTKAWIGRKKGSR